jgi:signal transduction histidine kinase
VSSVDKLQLLLGGDIIFPHLSVPFFSLFAGTFQVLFVRQFLETKRRLPAWDKGLLASITWWLLGAIVFWSSYWLLVEQPVSFLLRLSIIGGWGYLSATILCGVVAVKLTRQRVGSARLLLIGIFPAVLSMVYLFFLDIKFLLTGQFTFFDFNRIGRPAVVWMSIVFSGALLQRYQETRRELARQAVERERERSQLIETQRIQLEKQVAERTAELKQSLEHLKSTQVQLIQSEKMASLGELTAGIAHEIQNPLNFINNFSDVNKELIEDAGHELAKGNINEVKLVLADIKENEQKIIHHGKRADTIVKGMLQHSRASSGNKELTDINALADEYLRLAFHGLRAKDKDFNAILKTEFDESIGTIEVAPQDIGRVLLNLYNNAFYAVNEKKKQLNGTFEPTVEVTTKRVGDKIELSIKDNGTGIPQKVLDKIYQPFFTTKPTGQGTGLGLSLSYDIITKGHAGELKVDTKEGEYTQFIVRLQA